MLCARPAKITLYELLEGNRWVELGDYCVAHFNSERARVKAEGRRTDLGILLVTDHKCAAEEGP